MSKEEFSKLNAEKFADLYLDTMLVAMHKIDERAKKRKKENIFLEDNRQIKFNIRTQNVSK